jgi:hypothetical protein
MDGETAKIQVTVRRRFMDNVWLQLWYRWSTLPGTVVFSLIALILGMTFAGASMEMAYVDVANRMARHWWFAAGVMLLGLAVVTALQLLPHIFGWVVGAEPREVTFTFDDAGVTYSTRDTALLIGWPSVRAYTETSAALFIATRRASFRLPKRCCEGGDLDAVRALFASKAIRRVAIWRFV